jgi:hypothetical protein
MPSLKTVNIDVTLPMNASVHLAKVVVPITAVLMRVERDPVAGTTMVEYAIVDKEGAEVTRVAVRLEDTTVDTFSTDDQIAIGIEREMAAALSEAIIKRLRA